MLFGWPLVSDTASWSGGSWESALPASNVTHTLLARVARSTDESTPSTQLVCAFAAPQGVSVVALVRHNLSADAEWRVSASATSDFASLTYTSGWRDVWPEQWAPNALPAGHPNAATRRLTDADIAALDPRRDAVHVVEPEHVARYWRIELRDEANPDGFVQIGRAIIAPRYAPSLNFSVGAEFGLNDDTQLGTSLSGVRYYDVRPKGRSFAFSLTNLRESEALSVARDMAEALGRAAQVYVVQAPADAYNLQRRSFLATVRQPSAVTIHAAGYASIPFVLDEVL